MRVLLLTPPMTQLNTPYPATAYLMGFLRPRGVDASQLDIALELILKIYSQEGLTRIRDEILRRVSLDAKSKKKVALPQSVDFFLQNFEAYLGTIESAVKFLQGKDPSLSLRIISRNFLPEGPQFTVLKQFEELDGGEEGIETDALAWAFGNLGSHDRAKYLASLLINDIAGVIKDGVDARFELSRYGEKLAASSPTFDPLHASLQGEASLIDTMLDEVTLEVLERERPNVIGLTTPFPGNVYGAFRIAMLAKRFDPTIKTILGGGFVNTELRSLKEPRVFDFFDYIVLDDGYRPLQNILEHLAGAPARLLRTYVREGGKVVLKSDPTQHDIPQKDVGAPIYDGLSFDRYLSILEMLNPMHRLWSDGRWNKLTVAHGCYWKKCTFCDIGLDYIGRYEPNSADVLVDRIEQVMKETGQSGFHFVDEAAPPASLRSLAETLIRRKVVISWWGNIRFEKTFTPELCQLLARSGCVAISGGLEAASDRLLKKMKKGVDVEQVARVTKALTDAGIMVHAYLMYGFPTQTAQETVDSLERVRQLFSTGCIQSAFWHRFAATAHSPVGLNPKDYGIVLDKEPEVSFARNDLNFTDPTAVDHDSLGEGLRKALYNYMHGIGFDKEVHLWFEKIKVSPTQVEPDLIEQALYELYDPIYEEDEEENGHEDH